MEDGPEGPSSESPPEAVPAPRRQRHFHRPHDRGLWHNRHHHRAPLP